jgi:phospholipid N-methyltransferase
MSFLKQFFNNKSEVGAVAPSSKRLGNKMYGDLDFHDSKCIIEFGPGTGIFTLEILKRINKDTKLLVFETNYTFYNKLKSSIKDDRLILINDSAEKLNQYISANGIDKVDFIISSLPLTVFSKELKNEILDESVKYLKDGGQFIQFQYTLNAHKLLKDKFKSVKLKFTALNIPPAFVYRCGN